MNKLGFGFLRLPQKDGHWDEQAINAMVDAFLEGGGTYFDTAYTYLDGQSELAIRKSLVERKPRDAFRLCDKLPGYLCKSCRDCQVYFETMLARCGVDDFDVLMLHWLNEEHYAIAQRCDEFRFLREKKAEGLAREIGFSFHGSAALLDRILTDHPEVDRVLIQINYLDWESAGIESRNCYEVCLRHGVKVTVMEPVKGGTLATLPPEAEKKLEAHHPDWTPSDWALRFVQSLPGVDICLSGMGSREQVQANIRPFSPLEPEEVSLLMEARDIIQQKTAIGCTGCGYCAPHCPKDIPIPLYIRMYNELFRYPEDDWKILPGYRQATLSAGKATDCIACHSCESHCPQKLTIAAHMKTIGQRFSQ